MSRLILSNPIYSGKLYKKDFYDYDTASNDYNILSKITEKKDLKRMNFEYIDSYVNEIKQEIAREDIKYRIIDANENIGGETINSFQNVQVSKRELKSILKDVLNKNERKDTSTQTTKSDSFDLLEKKRKTETGLAIKTEMGEILKENDMRGEDTYSQNWFNTSKTKMTTRATRSSSLSSISSYSTDSTIKPDSPNSIRKKGLIGIFREAEKEKSRVKSPSREVFDYNPENTSSGSGIMEIPVYSPLPQGSSTSKKYLTPAQRQNVFVDKKYSGAPQQKQKQKPKTYTSPTEYMKKFENAQDEEPTTRKNYGRK